MSLKVRVGLAVLIRIDRDMSTREVHNDNALTNVCVEKFNKHR